MNCFNAYMWDLNSTWNESWPLCHVLQLFCYHKPARYGSVWSCSFLNNSIQLKDFCHLFFSYCSCLCCLLTQSRFLLVFLVMTVYLGERGASRQAPSAEPWQCSVGICRFSSLIWFTILSENTTVGAREEKCTVRDRECGTGIPPTEICLNCHDCSPQRLFCLSFSQMSVSGSEQQKHAAFSILTVLFSSLLCTYVPFPLKLSRSQKWHLQQFPVTSNNCFFT